MEDSLKIRMERYVKIAKLRDSGMKWKDIANIIGVSIARVQTIYMYYDTQIPDAIREGVRELYGYKCAFCDTTAEGKKKLSVHHIDGGEHIPSNLILVCDSCHSFLHKLKRQGSKAYNFFIKKGKKGKLARSTNKLNSIFRLTHARVSSNGGKKSWAKLSPEERKKKMEKMRKKRWNKK